MTTLTTETAAIASAAADTLEADEVFHVERRDGCTGHRVELARYAVGGGEERVLYGQRVDGVVQFLPGSLAVLVSLLGPTEDSTCRSRTTIGAEGCTKAVRRKRRNGASEPRCPAAREREDAS